MKTFLSVTKRNVKIFFKDKVMFFTSLITPVILLVLYMTFLADVYKDGFDKSIAEAGVTVPKKLINGMVGGQLVSSILAVSCVTVAFCSNLLMVNDKMSGAKKDMAVSPTKKYVFAFSYYASTLMTTLIVTLTAMTACLIYIACSGWYMSFGDVMLLLLDIFLLTMFGTALSSCVNVFLSTNGQASAVGTIVSSGYGFICGAYMPISQFGKGLQYVLGLLPGTYGTSLVRNHALAGALRECSKSGFPPDVVERIKDSVDCNLYFFGNKVSVGAMYGVMIGTVVLLVGIYILINVLKKEDNGK